jgi:hypothetical protein
MYVNNKTNHNDFVNKQHELVRQRRTMYMDKITKATEAKKTATPVKAEVKPFTKAAQVQAHPRPVVKPQDKPAKAEIKSVEKKPEPTPVQEEKVKAVIPEPAPQKPALTLEVLRDAILRVQQDLEIHAQEIANIKEAIARKRTPPAKGNGKVQIKDTQTGKVYPSKNGTYKALLKAGELKTLVEQGVFGPDPKRNSFGAYALFRAFPNRFIELKSEPVEQKV